MARRLTLPQLKKYDVTQKVVSMLADAESRTILFSIVKKGKTASELSQKYKICLLYTSPSPRDRTRSRMPSSA